MMLRALSVIVLLLCSGIATAQLYEELVVDLSENDRDFGTVIQANDAGYVIGTRDMCESGRCSGLMQLSADNTILWYEKADSFTQQRETLQISDSLIYYSGFNEFDPTAHIVKVYTAVGALDTIIDLSTASLKEVTISASQLYGDYHISGSVVGIVEDTIKRFAGLFWYHKDDAVLDTMITTTIDNIDVWDLRVTPDSMLLVSYYYIVPGTGSLNWHRRIEKYTIDKELVWVWDKGGLGHLDIANRSSLEVLDNGDIIIEHTHSMDPTTTSSALWCLDSEGNKKWQFDMSHVPTGSEKLYNIRKTANNDIIACGARTDVLAQDTRSGLICRISADGELLWKRTYADTIGPFDLIGGELLDIAELADGSLVATGFKNTRYVDSAGETRRDRDLWILHMDENGCLADRCGNDLTTSVAPVASSAIALYPNPTTGELCFTAAQTGVVTLYSSLGEQILVEQLRGQDCIDVSGILSGTYILHYRDEVSGQVFTEKVVKL